MEHLSVLAPKDDVHLDQAQLADLYMRMGPSEAEAILCRALEELAARLAKLEMYVAKNDAVQAAKIARGLVGIATQIGLIDLAQAARATANCYGRDDPVAQPAVLNRLIRVADRSLSEVWQSQDMTL